MIVATVCGLIAFSLLFIDLATKAWAYEVKISQPNYFLGIVRMKYLPGGNTGIAFGMFGQTEVAMIVITIFTVFMIVGLGVLFFTVFKKNTPAQVAIAVIEAGAVGNLVDRIVLRAVRDFVDVSPLGFGICNFADFFITFGAAALLLIIFFIGKDALIPLGKWRRQAKEEAAAEKAEKEAAKARAEEKKDGRDEK